MDSEGYSCTDTELKQSWSLESGMRGAGESVRGGGSYVNTALMYEVFQ